MLKIHTKEHFLTSFGFNLSIMYAICTTIENTIIFVIWVCYIHVLHLNKWNKSGSYYVWIFLFGDPKRMFDSNQWLEYYSLTCCFCYYSDALHFSTPMHSSEAFLYIQG